jgi:uncharacterized protein (TIGR02996 family)
MTEQEARSLLPGERLLTHIGKRTAQVRVVEVERWTEAAITATRLYSPGWRPDINPGDARKVHVREETLYPSGRIKPLIRRSPIALRHPPEPVAANVYADFLEEHGHPEAAALLRKSFPLADGKPV